MTGQDLRKVLDFENGIKAGDIVLAKWTNNYKTPKAKAEVVKVNSQSFRIRLLEDIQDWLAGQVFPIPRLALGGTGFSKWSYNNRLEPVEGY